MEIREKLLEAVRRYHLLDPQDRVLVGVSGGQDSLALLVELAELAPELEIELVVGHLHHGLRGEVADADQKYVGELAARLGLEFVTEITNVRQLAQAEGIGLEEAGRRARYRFFDRAGDEHQCNKIALAHTATDRAETLLMNLFRGAGLYGLRSIPPRRDRIIRPLILVTRQDTGSYCRTRGLAVCLDSTNEDPAPLRNRVRRELLPQLEREYGPGIEAALTRAAEHVLAEIEWTEPLVEEALQSVRDEAGLDAAGLRAMPAGLRHRVLRRFLSHTGHHLTDISRERWEALEALIERGGTGRRLELSHGTCVELTYGRLRLITEAPEPWDDVISLWVPGAVNLPDGRRMAASISACQPPYRPAEAHEAVLDADRAGDRLSVRQARPGDRFVPLGMTGSKKLQDFFVDNKVPREQRRPVVVAREGDGAIIWVVGHRVAQVARADEHTKRCLVLRLDQLEGSEAQDQFPEDL